MSSSTYLLAGQSSELERLQLQSRVWEPAGRRLLGEIGDGRGARAVDIGCGVLGWLRLLSEWVGPDGEVVGTDADDAMLGAASQFVADEGLGNVVLVKDDVFERARGTTTHRHPRSTSSSGSLIRRSARSQNSTAGVRISISSPASASTRTSLPRSWPCRRSIPICGCRSR